MKSDTNKINILNIRYLKKRSNKKQAKEYVAKDLKSMESNCIKEKKTHSQRKEHKQPLRMEVVLGNSKKSSLIHPRNTLN